MSSISTDETLNIVNPALLENNTTRQFFNELGIKEVDESVYIDKRIAKYTDQREVRIDQNIEDIEQFYIYALKVPHDKRNSFIQKLRENLTIQCKLGKNVIFSKLSDVYSDKWVDTFFKSEIRGTLRFLPQLEMRPSSNAPNPVESREAPPTSSFPGFSEPP